MAATSFAARRRSARSSPFFQTALSCSLIFCVIVAWYCTLLPRNPSLDPSLNTRNQDAAESTMTRRAYPSSEEHVDAQSPLGMNAVSSSRFKIPLRLITFNVRYAAENRVLGERSWDIRGPKLITQLRFLSAGHEAPFICLQECLYSQVKDVGTHLGESWSYIGRGRDKGPTDGEFSPVFYRSDIWTCERNETRWLSETPDVPSRGWDAALNRIVTMGEFTHRYTGTRVVVMSTHFDHLGDDARKNSANLLIQFASEWAQNNPIKPAAVLIGGDFNSDPDDGAYKIMTAKDSGISDIHDLVPESERYGNHITYTSFGEPYESPKRIDFLFIREPRKARVRSFGVLNNSFDDQVRLSDHRAVVADMDIPI